MNKQELIDSVAKNTKLSKKDTLAALNALTVAIVETVKKGEKVTITGFGTFSAIKRAARSGRNPQTGKVLKIAARKAPKFSVGKVFKEAVK